MGGKRGRKRCKLLRCDSNPGSRRFLTTDAAAEFLAARFPGAEFPPPFAERLWARTEGNPLFLQAALEHWIEIGVLTHADGTWTFGQNAERLADRVPEALRRSIELQARQLAPADQRLLQAASVAGDRFSAAAIAAGLDLAVEEVEERCDLLARRGWLVSDHEPVEWPDGTVAARYAFAHHCQREVLYGGIPPGRCTRLRRQIRARLDAAYCASEVREALPPASLAATSASTAASMHTAQTT